jgi:hypothetical protein
MSTTAILIILVAVALLLAVAMGMRAGPRVTQITRTTKRDDGKDGDDA